MLGSFRERFGESLDAFHAVITSPALRRVELSWAASITAYWAFIIALAVYAYDQGGAAAVGLVGVIRVLPAFIAAPFAGVLGDRYRRDLLLVILSFVRAGFMAATAAVLFAGGPTWLVYALSGGVALMASTVRPMQSALLPQLAKTPEELTAANLVLTTVESSGIFLGPAIGGLLLAGTNAETVFAAAAVAFVVASLLLVGLDAGEQPERRADGSFFGEFFGGFRAIASDRNLALIVTLYGIQTLVAGALNVLIVVASLELLDLGESGVGFLNSAVGVGGLLGAIAAFALVGRQRLASDFALGLVLWGIPIALIGVFPQPPFALILLAIVGIGNTVVDVAALTLLQRTVPDEVLTRVFGVVQSVFIGTVGLGVEAFERRPFAGPVNPDDGFEEPAVGQRRRLPAYRADGLCLSERGPDLAFALRLHPAQHEIDVVLLQRAPRGLHDGAIQGIAVRKRRGRQQGEDSGRE